MLHFTRMTMHNFGPYKGNQVIDFTDNSGVTIFGEIMVEVRQHF